MSIPHDILTAARIAGFEFETFIQEMDLNPDGNEASEELVETIARVAVAERERCAKIAAALDSGVDDIAAAIRGK